MIIVYPVYRLFAQPNCFYAIAEYIGFRSPEVLQSSFYELMELEFDKLPPEECEFSADEARFETEDDGEICTISLDNGFMCRLEVSQSQVKSLIRNNREFLDSSAIYFRLVTAIEESNPSLRGDIALCSPPTPGNNFLSSEGGEYFEGTFHLKSNPDQKYAFKVTVEDVEKDIMKTTIKPL